MFLTAWKNLYKAQSSIQQAQTNLQNFFCRRDGCTKQFRPPLVFHFRTRIEKYYLLITLIFVHSLNCKRITNIPSMKNSLVFLIFHSFFTNFNVVRTFKLYAEALMQSINVCWEKPVWYNSGCKAWYICETASVPPTLLYFCKQSLHLWNDFIIFFNFIQSTIIFIPGYCPLISLW